MNKTQQKIIKIYEKKDAYPSNAEIARKVGVSAEYVRQTLKEYNRAV